MMPLGPPKPTQKLQSLGHTVLPPRHRVRLVAKLTQDGAVGHERLPLSVLVGALGAAGS